jgi:hypothetical protein
MADRLQLVIGCVYWSTVAMINDRSYVQPGECTVGRFGWGRCYRS